MTREKEIAKEMTDKLRSFSEFFGVALGKLIELAIFVCLGFVMMCGLLIWSGLSWAYAQVKMDKVVNDG